MQVRDIFYLKSNREFKGLLITSLNILNGPSFQLEIILDLFFILDIVDKTLV
jgi:hypothetical protein